MRVKICGNRSGEEILMAVHYGADAVGLIVGARHHTEDDLDPDLAGRLLRTVPVYVNSVLVTHMLLAEQVLEVYEKVPASVIQLHDDIDVDEITIIKQELPHVPLIKAIHVVDDDALQLSKTFAPLVDALLLDTRTKERIGGTGQVHDWSISRRIVSSVDVPVILAGGLNPGNVRDAIDRVRPYGVDVNSGVEYTNGRKAHDKIRDFIKLAKCNNFHGRAS